MLIERAVHALLTVSARGLPSCPSLFVVCICAPWLNVMQTVSVRKVCAKRRQWGARKRRSYWLILAFRKLWSQESGNVVGNRSRISEFRRRLVGLRTPLLLLTQRLRDIVVDPFCVFAPDLGPFASYPKNHFIASSWLADFLPPVCLLDRGWSTGRTERHRHLRVVLPHRWSTRQPLLGGFRAVALAAPIAFYLVRLASPIDSTLALPGTLT